MEIVYFETYNLLYKVIFFKNPNRYLKVVRYKLKIHKKVDFF